ncbi:hypothetical protein GCM10011409_39550 [Lentibacillus populi]|uniref:Uncharacterized protein n=1 Tax=Lentibacillus populi TaxID=1827502 RepID=A0A9W5U0Y5_9BACI|nr:hypothetical protein GCM10011409_39550 [Lentibacillus populi]
MLRRFLYRIPIIIGLTILFLVDLMMVVPLASNQIFALIITLVFYMYLLYLIYSSLKLNE